MGLEVASIVLVKLEINVFIFSLMKVNVIFIHLSLYLLSQKAGSSSVLFSSFQLNSLNSRIRSTSVMPAPLTLPAKSLNNYCVGARYCSSSVFQAIQNYIFFVYATVDL